MEPMQSPPGANEGRLKDQGLEALVRGLAEQNPGLCVITTREPIHELAYVTSPAVERIELTQFDPVAGAGLLWQPGRPGRRGGHGGGVAADGGHALALVLLGTLLRDTSRREGRRAASA